MGIIATHPINGMRRKCWGTSATRSAFLRIARCGLRAATRRRWPGFEQDDYVKNGPFARAPLAEIIEDYIAVRRATLTLLRNLDEAAWVRRGVANKNEVSVRALAYIIAGHELHHRRILEEKYFAER